MPIENGVNWEPIDPQKRGHFREFGDALTAALNDLTRERNEFYDSLVDNWQRLFPELPARPGRYQEGYIYLYVTKATTSYLISSKLNMIKRRLAELPGAPKRLNLRVEIHSKC